jgi:lipoprotein-anchoring transpeptidase ErfK/SrfK
MIFRTAGAIATLLLGLGGSGGQALAQFYPPQPAYPPPQAYPPPLANPPSQSHAPQRLIPAEAEGEQLYDAQGRPLPPGTVFRQAPPGYREVGGPQQGSAPQAVPGYEPAAPSAPAEQEATRPPLPLGPAQPQQGATGADPRNMAAFPPEVRPETGPRKALPPQFRRALVDYHTKEPAGTLIVDTQNTYLYLVLGQGKAMRYGIGVGREGFTWSGSEKVTRMAEWPDWNPPEEMIERQPYLPRFMAGGDGNPLGARALYLGKTIYRIHGTNQPSTIGTFVSSGCIRLTNEDVTDLYTRVKVGTRVVVLPGKPPATAAATPPAAPPAAAAAPPAGLAPPAPLVQPPAGGGAPVMISPLAPPPSAMAR